MNWSRRRRFTSLSKDLCVIRRRRYPVTSSRFLTTYVPFLAPTCKPPVTFMRGHLKNVMASTCAHEAGWPILIKPTVQQEPIPITNQCLVRTYHMGDHVVCRLQQLALRTNDPCFGSIWYQTIHLLYSLDKWQHYWNIARCRRTGVRMKLHDLYE